MDARVHAHTHTHTHTHSPTHAQNKHRACNFNFKILLIAKNFSHGINMEIQTLVRISTPWWHEILNSFELKLDCETERNGHQSEHSESQQTSNPYHGIAGLESGLQDTIWSRCWDSESPLRKGPEDAFSQGYLGGEAGPVPCKAQPQICENKPTTVEPILFRRM